MAVQEVLYFASALKHSQMHSLGVEFLTAHGMTTPISAALIFVMLIVTWRTLEYVSADAVLSFLVQDRICFFRQLGRCTSECLDRRECRMDNSCCGSKCLVL